MEFRTFRVYNLGLRVYVAFQEGYPYCPQHVEQDTASLWGVYFNGRSLTFLPPAKNSAQSSVSTEVVRALNSRDYVICFQTGPPGKVKSLKYD